MPSLQQQASEALKTIQSAQGSRDGHPARHLHMERDLVILWGTYRGWTDRYTASQLGVSKETVYNVRHRFSTTPKDLFRLPVLHQGIVGQGRTIWRCEV